MVIIEARLRSLGLILPPPTRPPPGVVLPFQFVHVVGRELSVEQGYAAARLTALSILGSLKRSLGDLDRIAAWSRVFGMVNSAPGFNQQPSVINGFSDVVLEVFGATVGAHCRSAVGLAELPFNIPVEIEGEVELINGDPTRQ